MPRPRKLTEACLQVINKMREEGYTFREIAKKFKVSRMTIWRYLKAYPNHS